MSVTIGVDVGTTAVKAVAASADGTVVAVTRVESRRRATTGGGVEHDAATVWRDGVRRAVVDVASAAVARGHDVLALDVAGMVPAMCPVDAVGVPIGPGLLYGDERAAGGPRGADPSSSGEASRMLRYFARAYPDAAGYWPPQAVASAALCGRGVIDPVIAMTTVPLFDFTGWDESVVRAADARPDQLPDIIADDQVAGAVVEELGPDLRGTVVGPGTIDAFAEQLVAGADEAGDVLVIIGGTLIVWSVVPEWIDVPGLWTVPHTAPGLTLVGGPSNAGGIFKDWADGVLRPTGDDRVQVRDGDPATVDLDPADIPVWLPFIRGERTPLHDPTRRAELHDAHLGHGPAQLRRAVYEASGFVVRRHLELAGLHDGTGPVRARRVVASGGGSGDDEWVQAIADVTGLPVECTAITQGAALGAAYLARVATGLEEGTGGANRWARSGRTFTPRADWSSAGEDRYRRFVELSGPPFTAPHA